MENIRIIPCLLLKNQGLYKTVRFKNSVYVGDPINAVRIFNEKEVDELIFLDISATPAKRGPNYDLISQIASECFMPFGYGGGITKLEEIETLFTIGVEKVIINSSAYSNIDLFKQASSKFGNQSIVASIDVKRNFWGSYEVFINNGTINIKEDPVTYAKKLENAGAGEIFINSIDNDGTYKGFDIEIIRKIANAVEVPVVACGGAGKLDDFRTAVIEGGASAVSAGSLFVFHGKHKAVLINYPNQSELKNLFSK